MNESEIIKRVIDGATQEFNKLVEAHFDSVYRVIFLYVKNPEITEDLTQDTFMKAFTNIAAFRFKSSFKTWLIRIAINTVKDYFRKSSIKNRYFVKCELMEIQDFRSKPDELLESLEFKKFLDVAISELPEKLRIVYILREQEKYSYEEIADIIKKPIGTVESRLFNARKIIQQKFLKWIGEEK
ncbi:MAG TPA: sigma-70 family RNA polymerase sigma factor [bacterium]|nr:sigma-70 family RNA polymerase sigma factor [bacterium]